jgi:hypothetical protein
MDLRRHRCRLLQASDGAVTISIGPRRDPLSAIFNGAGVCIGGVMVVGVGSHLNDQPMSVLVRLFLAGGILFVAVVLCVCGLQLLWILFGLEQLTVRDNMLTWRRHLPGFDKLRTFNMPGVTNIRLDVRMASTRGNRYLQRRVAFDYNGKRVICRSLLASEDAGEVRDLLTELSS